MTFEMGVTLAGAAADLAKEIDKRVSKAQRSGVRKAGGLVRKTFKQRVGFRGESAPRGQLGTRTGLFRKSIKLKTFQYGNKTWGASLKVKGRRSFVFRLHEDGYTLPGGTSIDGRKPGQAALEDHAAEIPRLLERFIEDALKTV